MPIEFWKKIEKLMYSNLRQEKPHAVPKKV